MFYIIIYIIMKKLHILKGTIKIIKIKKIEKIDNRLLILFEKQKEEYNLKYPFFKSRPAFQTDN